ncbi:hypothetical protein HDU67_004146 [Dinochytrium kinnereticum]|nr:hypothetical protein HDU67_004146 [Dinochytrium kinnereticum]
MLSTASGPNVDKNGRAAINGVYVQLLKAGSASTLVASCVCPTKRVGVVFWNSKVAVLQPEMRLLYILGPDVAPPAKGAPPIPETLIFPLNKFSVSTLESSGGANTAQGTASQASNANSSPSQTEAAVASSSGSPILILTNTETSHTVTLQFESSQVKKEWQVALSQISDGHAQKSSRAPDNSKTVMATSKMDF